MVYVTRMYFFGSLFYPIGIDGFYLLSHIHVYTYCCNNNRATTLSDSCIGTWITISYLMWSWSRKYWYIAHFMLITRGTVRGSMLSSSSNHNQCIEHLWRDVDQILLRQFHLFNYIPWNILSSRFTELPTLLALHYTFFPSIVNGQEEVVGQ